MVLKGKLTITTDDDEQELSENDAVYIPGNVIFEQSTIQLKIACAYLGTSVEIRSIKMPDTDFTNLVLKSLEGCIKI